MSLAAILLLAAAGAPVAATPTPPRVVAVRGTASAEILRSGRSDGVGDPDELPPQRSRTNDGRVLTEFR